MTESAARELAEEILPPDYTDGTRGGINNCCVELLMKALLSSRLVEMPRVETLADFIEQMQKFQYEDPKEDARELAQAIVNYLRGER